MKAPTTVWTLSAFVVLLAAMDLQVSLRPGLDPIPEAEMQEGVRQLRDRQQPGDVLVHSPLFTMVEQAPIGALRARPDRPRPEVMDSRRVLVLDRAEAPMSLLGAPKSREGIGDHLELRTYEPSGEREVPVYDLLSELGPKVLRIERPLGVVKSRCTQPRAEGGWSCPSEAEWLYAAPRTLRIGGQDAECVWAHPTTGGAVVFTLPGPQAPIAGRDLVLEVAGGLADDAVNGTPGGATVFVQVMQGARKLGRLAVPNAVGWHRLEVSLEPSTEVELIVTTSSDGRRHHCLNARVLERPRDKL